jgi:hypothetical protein
VVAGSAYQLAKYDRQDQVAKVIWDAMDDSLRAQQPVTIVTSRTGFNFAKMAATQVCSKPDRRNTFCI